MLHSRDRVERFGVYFKLFLTLKWSHWMILNNKNVVNCSKFSHKGLFDVQLDISP